MDNCLHCKTTVHPRQEAIQCDTCNLWQHRTCNTGISRDQYRRLVKNSDELEWNCSQCSMQAAVDDFDERPAEVEESIEQPPDVEDSIEQPPDVEDSIGQPPAADATFHVSLGSSFADPDKGTCAFLPFNPGVVRGGQRYSCPAPIGYRGETPALPKEEEQADPGEAVQSVGAVLREKPVCKSSTEGVRRCVWTPCPVIWMN